MTDFLLEEALQYAARGWPVFALSRSKVPFKGSHGHLDASTDPIAIAAMWREHPGANVGLATGALVVFDCDGTEGKQTFERLGPLVHTRAARTPRGGLHIYFAAPAGTVIRCHNAPRASGQPGLDIKAAGGFVLLPPSRGRTGAAYQWLNDALIAPLPGHLLQYVQSLGASRREAPKAALPAHLAGRAMRNLTEPALAGFGLDWSAHEEARIRGALKCLGADIGYDKYFKVCCALHNLKWVTPDTDRGFLLLDEWASGFSYYNPDGLEKKWESIEKSKRIDHLVTVGSLFAMATEAGWRGEVALPAAREGAESGDSVENAASHANVIQANGNALTGVSDGAGDSGLNGHASASALFAPIERPIIFPDTDKAGHPRPTCTNAGVAILGLGIACRKDVFHEKLLVGGHAIQAWGGDLSDDAVHMIRKVTWRRFGFDPTERHARDAAIQLCLENQFNPIVDYLTGLQWDRRPRIERWTVDYLDAADTPLNREFGRLMLIAAARRARAPGTKFDQIVILEGKQGTGKSSAIRILAGDENFSDQHVLGASDKEQQEAFRGVWLHEIAELAGMRRTDVERIKQFARRTEDRARPAYGRLRVDMKRRGIFVATTNEQAYLKDWDRAFWPIATGTIALERLKADRDQLWAEAAWCEARGDSLELPEALRAIAKHEQAERHEIDAWESLVAEAIGRQKVPLDTSVNDILMSGTFQMRASEVNQPAQNRIARILKKLNFERYYARVGKIREWRYRNVEPLEPLEP